MKKFNKSKSVLLILILSFFSLTMAACSNDTGVEESSVQSVAPQSSSSAVKSSNLDLKSYYFKSFDDEAYMMANAKIGIPSEWEELSREPYKSDAEKMWDAKEDSYPNYSLPAIWAFTTESFDFHMSILENYGYQEFNPNFPENYGTYDYSLGNLKESNVLEIGDTNVVEELNDRALRYSFPANDDLGDKWKTELRFYFHDGNPPDIDDLRKIATEMLESYTYAETVDMPIIMNYAYGFYPEDSPVYAGINQKLSGQKEKVELSDTFQSPGFVSLYKSGGFTDDGYLYNFLTNDSISDNSNSPEEIVLDSMTGSVKYYNPYLGDNSYGFSANYSPLAVKKNGLYVTNADNKMYIDVNPTEDISTDFKKEYYPISKNLLLDDWGNLYYFNFELEGHYYDNFVQPITDEDLTLISENVKEAASTENGQIYILTITGDLLYLIQPTAVGGSYYPLLATNVESMRLINGVTTTDPYFTHNSLRPVSLFFLKENTLYCMNEPDEKEEFAAINSMGTVPAEYYIVEPLELEGAVTYDWSAWTETLKLKNHLMLIAKNVETYNIDTIDEILLLAQFDSNGEYYINNKKQDISTLIPEGRKIMQTGFIFEEPIFLLDDGTICFYGKIYRAI